MQTDIRLSISVEAKSRIAILLNAFRSRFNRDAVPALMWIESTLNNDAIESQPAIGLYDNRDDIAPGDLLLVDGIEIAIAVAVQDIVRFQDKILHYESGGFTLR